MVPVLSAEHFTTLLETFLISVIVIIIFEKLCFCFWHIISAKVRPPLNEDSLDGKLLSVSVCEAAGKTLLCPGGGKLQQ